MLCRKGNRTLWFRFVSAPYEKKQNSCYSLFSSGILDSPANVVYRLLCVYSIWIAKRYFLSKRVCLCAFVIPSNQTIQNDRNIIVKFCSFYCGFHVIYVIIRLIVSQNQSSWHERMQLIWIANKCLCRVYSFYWFVYFVYALCFFYLMGFLGYCHAMKYCGEANSYETYSICVLYTNDIFHSKIEFK